MRSFLPLIAALAATSFLSGAPVSHDFGPIKETSTSRSVASALCTSSDSDLSQTARPTCFKSRSSSTLRVFLVHYGNWMSEADLKRVFALLAPRFSKANRQAIQLELVDTAVVSLKSYSPQEQNLEKIAATIPGPSEKREASRLKRIWYSERSSFNLTNEIHAELLRAGHVKAMKASDAVLVLSAAQFPGLGFFDGGFAVTKQPTEIAWTGSDGGFTKTETDAMLVDELIHEVGHVLGLAHPDQTACDNLPAYLPRGMPGETYAQCCARIETGSDVAGYCRERSKVDETFFYGFTSCTQDFLTSQSAPVLQSGGRRPFQQVGCPMVAKVDEHNSGKFTDVAVAPVVEENDIPSSTPHSETHEIEVAAKEPVPVPSELPPLVAAVTPDSVSPPSEVAACDTLPALRKAALGNALYVIRLGKQFDSKVTRFARAAIVTYQKESATADPLNWLLPYLGQIEQDIKVAAKDESTQLYSRQLAWTLRKIELLGQAEQECSDPAPTQQ